MTISLKRAYVADAEEIWQMQKTAFAGLLEKYRDYDTNPACETVERVREKLSWASTYFYFIFLGDSKVGAIRIVDSKDGLPKRISPLFVLPEYRNRGIAQQAIKLCEEIHGADNWSLGTILQEAGNCYLYEKMGYRISGRTTIINERMTIIGYEK